MNMPFAHLSDIYCKAVTIEAKIRDYEHALDSAVGLYLEIQQLIATQSNDYNPDVTKRLTNATINFKYMIKQTGEK